MALSSRTKTDQGRETELVRALVKGLDHRAVRLLATAAEAMSGTLGVLDKPYPDQERRQDAADLAHLADLLWRTNSARGFIETRDEPQPEPQSEIATVTELSTPDQPAEPEQPPAPARPEWDRDDAIKAIRAALRRRSGKAWSVKGGQGASWGWIYISAPPARLVNGDSMTEEDRTQLGELLGLDEPPHHQGENVPSTRAYRQEYVDRAEGRTPTVLGKPHWD